MKRFIVVACLVVVLAGGFSLTAYAAPNPLDLLSIIQKVVSKFELEIASLNNKLQARIIHVTLQDQNCITDRISSVSTGWCPDGVLSNFSISDPNFIPNNTVITAQASSPVDTGVIKIDNCTYRAVTGVGSAPLIRLVCEFAPSDGSTLNYVLVSHQ